MMVSGAGRGQGTGFNPNGAPDPGGGGITAVPADFSISLTSDHQNLILTVTPSELFSFDGSLTYRIFWLDPAIFSLSDIYSPGQTTGQGISVFQGRKQVIDINGGSGTVSTAITYLPYASGGWMYAVVISSTTTKELRLSGTNFVPVPVLGANGQPSSTEVPVNLSVLALGGTAHPPTARLIQFGWTNAPSLITVAYVKIVATNYWADPIERDLAVFKVNTLPGARQGILTQFGGLPKDEAQAVVLEADVSVGAHNITWSFVPMTAALVALPLAASPNVVTAAIS